METFIAIVAILFGIVGIVGSVAPALPGPPLSWVGLLVLYIWGTGTNGSGEPVSTTLLLVWLRLPETWWCLTPSIHSPSLGVPALDTAGPRPALDRRRG